MYSEFKLTPYLRKYIESSLSESLRSIGFKDSLIQDLFKCLDDFNFESFKNNYAQQLDAVHEINFYQELVPNLYNKYVIPYIPSSRVVMDIGCGNGVLAKNISESSKFDKVVGIDVVSYPEWASFKNNKLRYEVVDRSDFEQYLLKNIPDTVLLTWTLHHMEYDDQVRYLEYIRQQLKTGSVLVVLEDSYSENIYPETGIGQHSSFMKLSSEDRHTVMSVLDWISNRVLSRSRTCPVTFTYRTLEKWKDLFIKSGFEVVDSRYIGFPLPKNINVPQSLLIVKAK